MFTVSVLISESKWHSFSLLSSAIFTFDAEAFRIFWRVFKGDNLVIEDYLWTLTNDGFENNFLTILLAYHVVCFITMSNLLRSDLPWQAENERDCKNDYSAWEIEQWGVKRRHKYTRTDIRHCVLRRLIYEHLVLFQRLLSLQLACLVRRTIFNGCFHCYQSWYYFDYSN